MSWVLAILQFGAGHRTEIIAFINVVMQALAASGVIDQTVANEVGQVSVPLGAMTFAAKVSRLPQEPPASPPPTVDVS